LLFSLSVEQILQYWSLLSPDQKEAFLLAHVPQLRSEQLMALSGKEEHIESMFDKFAGIYHAFNRLEVCVREALDKGREADAEYRLLGEKYDSLPSLLHKVLEDQDGDPVNRYVSLLCAREVLKIVAGRFPDFKQKHQLRWKEIEVLVKRSGEIRNRFTFGTLEERTKFLEWFERMFFLEIALPAVEEAQE